MKPMPPVIWSKVSLSPFTLILGSENYLAGRAIRLVRELARAAHPSLEVSEVQDGEYSPGLLLNLAAPSLFAEPRLVIIHGTAEGLLEDLEQLAINPPEETYVVVRVPSLVGHGGKIKTVFASKAQVVQCDEIKRDSDRIEFIKNEFAVSGVKIDADAVRALVNAFNEDLGELGGACAQLINSGYSQVSAETVELTFEGRIETNAFKIADAALAGNASEAIRLLRHGLATGIDEVALTAALAMRVRQLARLFNDRNAAPAALGMQPWQLDKARKELVGWDEDSLVALVQQLADTDAAVKGASKDPAYALEKLLLRMATKGQ